MRAAANAVSRVDSDDSTSCRMCSRITDSENKAIVTLEDLLRYVMSFSWCDAWGNWSSIGWCLVAWRGLPYTETGEATCILPDEPHFATGQRYLPNIEKITGTDGRSLNYTAHKSFNAISRIFNIYVFSSLFNIRFAYSLFSIYQNYV